MRKKGSLKSLRFQRSSAETDHGFSRFIAGPQGEAAQDFKTVNQEHKRSTFDNDKWAVIIDLKRIEAANTRSNN
jgi:hypothetical protein